MKLEEIVEELNSIQTGMGGTKVVPNRLIKEIVLKLSNPMVLPIESCNYDECWCHHWQHDLPKDE